MRLLTILLTISPPIFAIISPSSEELENDVNSFNEWRDLREKNWEESDFPIGWRGFHCNPIHSTPLSVHQLTPSDIAVISAIGDSLSVGQAATATSIFDIKESNRGVNFVTGSDVQIEQQVTLNNIFSQFSTSLKGGSSKIIKKFYDFNFAVSGAVSSDLPSQAKRLASSLRHKLGDRNENTWKFLNIFIGHNDLCHICQNQTIFNPNNFGASIRSTLSIIRDEIPKVFVNIIPPINIEILTSIYEVSQFCVKAHKILCPCLSNQSHSHKHLFDAQLEHVANEFQQNNQFAIVISKSLDIPEIPKLNNKSNAAFLALDCFHFSQMAHDIAAKQVWNNIFDNKTRMNYTNTDYSRFKCPPINCPYLQTSNTICKSISNRNSTSSINPKRISIPLLIIFTIATISTLLFTITTIRHKRHGEEHQSLLANHHPIRADLNDNIF